MAVVHIDAIPAQTGAMSLETYELTKRFGGFTALDRVSINVARGSVHALLGENGAGKSTLVKCVSGFHRAEEGSILCDGREREIANPVVARALGIGMVYQHFTIAPGMTVAENLLLAGGKTSAIIDWTSKRAELKSFLASTPFSLDLDARPSELAAGEKQKLELLKQLYLKPRLLILDEPTSVLTPQEADEVLGHLRAFARSGQCTIVLITHKFREVTAYADDVTVLRRGKAVHHAAVASTSPRLLAATMVGESIPEKPVSESPSLVSSVFQPPVVCREAVCASRVALEVKDLHAYGDRGTLAVRGVNLRVHPGEILGVAGVSGNGQRELVEALVGQRPRVSGSVSVMGERYGATRAENWRLKVRSLPEEPLRNACVGDLSVAENMALRDFEQKPMANAGVLNPTAWRARARRWISEYGIKTRR